ncbi:hypothetical protein [Mycobacteroides abscessus]|uniref:hypothetical protein n=1 Tax=Mycobacteroides abscessus TaxID=36809 RepID=UPI0005E119BA|nr:hypothetical protein [Mycobacteroides abscessus]CPW23613.1 Uncharacterised protein [Mycobacteroides abscessus]
MSGSLDPLDHLVRRQVGVPPVAAVPDAPGEEADTLGQTIGYIALAVFAAVVFIVLVVSIARSGRGVEKL